MILVNTKTPIEPANPQVLDYIKPQQNSKELTLADNKNYILLTTCLFEAILNEYSNKLLPRDIIFFVQLLNLYNSALSKNQKSIIYASAKLAKLLGYSAKEKSNMRSTTLKLVKKLEQLGFLNVIRHKNKKGSDEVNEIVPILPDRLYEKIKHEPSNFNVDCIKLAGESNIQHILRTKLFTPIELEFMKSLFDDVNISNTQKIFYLNCIITAYQNYQTTGKLSFSATSQELISKNNVSKRTLARILDYIKNQYPDYFIEVNHSYSKSDDIHSNRYDRSTFIISINPIVIPKSFLNKDNLEIQKVIAQTKTVEEKVEYRDIANASLDADNETKKPNTYKGSQAGVPKKHPSSAKKASLNNKNIIIKISNKNIDANIDKNLDKKNEALDKREKNNQIKPQTFIQTSHSEHLESEQSSLSSKSLKNSVKDFIDALPSPSNSNAENASSTIQDISDRKNKLNIPKNKAAQAKARNDRKHKDFRYFYPISEQDSSILNFKANREFDTNFTNQLLLKLSTKYPEKRFKNKFTFSSYMIKALKNEHHQGPRVNNPSFRFSCNIDEQEKRVLECEQYLSKVESSSGTCKISQVKKKIAGRFSSEISHSILTTAQFIESSSRELLTILLPEHLALSKMQREILMREVCSVYGNNKCYLDSIKIDYQISEVAVANEEGNTEEAQSALTSEPSCSKPRSTPLSTLPEDSVWRQVRQALVLQYGNDIDEVWFSKVVAKECKETSLLLLTMPIRFMADWLKNHYGYAISRISGTFGFKYIEYNY